MYESGNPRIEKLDVSKSTSLELMEKITSGSTLFVVWLREYVDFANHGEQWWISLDGGTTLQRAGLVSASPDNTGVGIELILEVFNDG